MREQPDRKSTRLNSSHLVISYAVFCLKKKKKIGTTTTRLDTDADDAADDEARLPALTVHSGDSRSRQTGVHPRWARSGYCFFFNDTATTEIYPLSLHDALPI